MLKDILALSSFLLPSENTKSVRLWKERQTGSSCAKWKQSVLSLPLIQTQRCLKGPVWWSRNSVSLAELCVTSNKLKDAQCAFVLAALESQLQAISGPNTLCGWGDDLTVCVWGHLCRFLQVPVNHFLYSLHILVSIHSNKETCISNPKNTNRCSYGMETLNIHIKHTSQNLITSTHSHTHKSLSSHSSDNSNSDWFLLNQN